MPQFPQYQMGGAAESAYPKIELVDSDGNPVSLGGGDGSAAVAAHVAMGDPHSQYTTNAEVSQSVTDAIASHAASADPHSQYATASELSSAIASVEISASQVTSGQFAEARLPVRSGTSQTLTASSTINISPALREQTIGLSSASAITLTSNPPITVASISNGQVVFLTNAGLFNIVLPASSAIVPTQVMTLTPGARIALVFSTLANAWTVLSGTIATQNANAVAIGGGTIDGVTIGNVTAGSGRFSSLSATNLTSGRLLLASGIALVSSAWAQDSSGNVTFPSNLQTGFSGNYAGFLMSFQNAGGSFNRNGINVSAGNNDGGAVFLRFSSANNVYTSDFSMLQGVVSLNRALKITDTTPSTAPTNGAEVIDGGLGIGGNAQIGGVAVANQFSLRSGAFTRSEVVSGGLTGNRLVTYGNVQPPLPALHDEWHEYDSTGRPVNEWFWDGLRWLGLHARLLSISTNALNISAASTTRDMPLAIYPYSSGLWIARLVFDVWASGDQSVNNGYTIAIQKGVPPTPTWTTIGTAINTVTMLSASRLQTVQNSNLLLSYDDAKDLRLSIARNGGVSSPAINVGIGVGVRDVRGV